MRLALFSLVLAAVACGRPPLEVPELEYAEEVGFPEPPPLPPLGAGRFLVTNSLDDSVSLLPLDGLGTDAFVEQARLPVGLSPVELEGVHHAAIAPAGDRFYVALSMSASAGSGPHGAHGTGTEDGYVLAYRVSDHRLLGSQRVEKNPGDLALSADGSRLYVSHYDLAKIQAGGTDEQLRSNLLVLDALTLAVLERVPLCPAAHGIRVLPDARLVVSCLSDEIALVDPRSSPTSVTRVKLPGAGTATAPAHEPYAITVSPDGSQVWVSTLKSESAFFFDPALGAFDVARTASVNGPAMFGQVSADGSTLYLPYQQGNRLAAIDTATGQPRGGDVALVGCTSVHQTILSPDERFALSVCEGDHVGPGALHVLELGTGARTNLVALGLFPDFVGLIPGSPR